eukprot:g5983.t1
MASITSSTNTTTTTTAENTMLKQQQELYHKKYNKPMTSNELENLIERFIILQGLYFQDLDIYHKYDDKEYWENISDGLHVMEGTKSNKIDLTSNNENNDMKTFIKSISNQGYTIITENNKKEILYMKIKNTIKNLKEKGWPPSFIFIYDEIWYEIILNAFDIYKLLLQDDQCYMESDLNCWSLRKEKNNK